MLVIILKCMLYFVWIVFNILIVSGYFGYGVVMVIFGG